MNHFSDHCLEPRRLLLEAASPRPGRLAWLLLVLASTWAGPFSTNSAAQPDYAAFRIVTERNIFNTTRAHRTRGGREDTPPPVDTITLYGTFIYQKGPYAFFTGSSAEYSKVLAPGQSIAGYTVLEVGGSGVKLAAGTNTFELRVGMQLRREEGGNWQIAGDTAMVISSSTTTAADTSGGDDSDVMKRMMKQREQELK
jgi:hypothetical protein